MKGNLRKTPKLARLLQSHQVEIVANWANQVHKIHKSHYQNYSLEEVTGWVSQKLNVIIKSISSGSNLVLKAYLKEIAFSRLADGFSIYEVTEGILLAKEAVFPIILRLYPTDSTDVLDAITQVNLCLRYMINYFEYLFSEAMHSQLLAETNQRLAESESIKRTMVALLQKLTLDEVLEIVCSEARQSTNAKGSAVLLLEDEWLRVTFSNGSPLPALERMPVKDSFAELALKDGQPILVNNPASQMQAYHRNPDLKSLLVIPLYVEGMSIGVINVVNKPGGFANDDIRIMSLFAVQAAIAIENARLHHQAEQLAVVNERQRLARDLHDSVTQTLYSLSLFADATHKALQKNKVTKALDHLGELRKLTREAMLDMRLLIFELYPPVLQKEGLATALQTRLESVEARSGIRTEYHVVNERRLPLETETELFRIAQETLTNVVKHAQAEYLRVSMHYEPNQIRLKIEDNGIGFDLERASKGGGFGLKGILERAQRINGQLHIESSLNNGTIVEVVVKI